MRVFRASIALLLGVAMMATGTRAPGPDASSDAALAAPGIQRADAIPLTFVTDAAAFGILFEGGSNRHSTGSARLDRAPDPTAPAFILRSTGFATVIRAHLDYTGELHAARSGWFFFGTTAPPPIRV